MRFTEAALAALLACAAAVPAAAASEEIAGVAPGGAAYRIAVSEGWAPGDGLVLVQHGFSFDPVADPTLGPLRDRMLADGFAVAASGYRQRGWALFTARDDNVELVELFRARFGEPGPLVMAGGSMGGLISLKLAEDPRLRAATAGVLALCPAADGVAAWDTAFDLRLAYDAICAPADGGDLPRGAEPTPWALDLDQLPASVDDPEDSDALLLAATGIARCTGLGLPAPLRTGGMRERLQRLMTVIDNDDEETLLQQLAYAVIGLSELVRAPDKLAGRVPFFNRARVAPGLLRDLPYGIGDDATVRRVERDDFARLDFHRVSSLDGSGAARVVSLHTVGDRVVPLWHQRMVAARYPQALIGVTRNDTPRHCGFSGADIEGAWLTLRDWISEDTPAPTPETLRANCLSTGADAADCRIEAYAPSLLALAPQQRRSTLTDVLAIDAHPVSGLWAAPEQPAQGLMLEELDAPLGSAPSGEQRVALYWYTWAPACDPQPGPRWIVGIGRIHESALFADDLIEVHGGAFAQALDPANLQFVPWGSVQFALDDLPGVLRYSGEWGSGERALSPITRSQYGLPAGLDPAPPPLDFHRIGTYYDPAHPGQGWVLNQYDGPDGRVASLLVWYTFDMAGRASWLFGLDADAADGLEFAMTRAVQGGTFETGAPPMPPALQPWGTVTLETSGCEIAAVNYSSAVPGYGSGRIAVVRLTLPDILYPVRNCPR